jgi:hypothetical protein
VIRLLLTHGAEPVSRTHQLCSHSRASQHFMEPVGLYRVHKSPPLVPILSHINPMHTIPSYLSKIHFNIVHPTYILVFPVVSFLPAFPPISYMHSSSSQFVLHAPPISDYCAPYSGDPRLDSMSEEPLSPLRFL